jgi:hypothetical protein
MRDISELQVGQSLSEPNMDTHEFNQWTYGEDNKEGESFRVYNHVKTGNVVSFVLVKLGYDENPIWRVCFTDYNNVKA